MIQQMVAEMHHHSVGESIDELKPLLLTRFGRWVYAIGSNEQTARLCGMEWLGPFVVHGTLGMTRPQMERHAADYRRLPPGFHWYFENPVQPLDPVATAQG